MAGHKLLYSDAEKPIEGVTLLKDQEVLKIMYNSIEKWKPQSEMWSFTYGTKALALASGLAGTYFNNIYRRGLLLRKIALFSTHLPAAALPALAAFTLQSGLVQNNILLKNISCPLCLQVRSMMLQAFTGGIYPLLLATIGSFHFANVSYTYTIPSLIKEPKEFFALWVKKTKPYAGRIGTILLCQMLLSEVVTMQQTKATALIHTSLTQSVDKELY